MTKVTTNYLVVDCEFIKPVSGYECQLCNIFLRNGYKIKEHIKTFQHMKIYEVSIYCIIIAYFLSEGCMLPSVCGVLTLSRSYGYVKNSNETLVQVLLYGDKNLPNDLNKSILLQTLNFIHQTGRLD